jgi:Ca-activated chloride channel homolog
MNAPVRDALLVAKTRRAKIWRALGAAALTVVVVAAALAYPLIARGARWLAADWRNAWALFALVVVPPVWWWTTFGQDLRRPRLKIGTVKPLATAPRGLRVRLRDLPGVLRAVAVGLFIAAIARPVSVLSDEKATESGIDIMVVLDLSGSMSAVLDADARDLPRHLRPEGGRRLTRLDVSKIVVQDFIQRRKSDRIGAVVFGTHAYILSPLTLDYQLLGKLIANLQLGVVSEGKTAIGEALGTAVARFRNSDARSKVVVLLTDGHNNAGKMSPENAIDAAVTHGVKTYTIQIGDDADVDVFRGYDRFKQPIYSQQRFPTDPELLQRIADKTGGSAFIATDAKALQGSMHEILNQLDKTEFEAPIAHYEDLFPLLLFPAVVLIGLEALLRALLLRRFP